MPNHLAAALLALWENPLKLFYQTTVEEPGPFVKQNFAWRPPSLRAALAPHF